MYTRAVPATRRPGEPWKVCEVNAAMYPEAARVLNAKSDQVTEVDTLPDGRKVVCFRWRTVRMPASAFWYYAVEGES